MDKVHFWECAFCRKIILEDGSVVDTEPPKEKGVYIGWKSCGQHPEEATHIGLTIFKDGKNTYEVVWITPADFEAVTGQKYSAGQNIWYGYDTILSMKTNLMKYPIIPKRY